MKFFFEVVLEYAILGLPKMKNKIETRKVKSAHIQWTWFMASIAVPNLMANFNLKPFKLIANIFDHTISEDI